MTHNPAHQCVSLVENMSKAWASTARTGPRVSNGSWSKGAKPRWQIQSHNEATPPGNKTTLMTIKTRALSVGPKGLAAGSHLLLAAAHAITGCVNHVCEVNSGQMCIEYGGQPNGLCLSTEMATQHWAAQ